MNTLEISALLYGGKLVVSAVVSAAAMAAAFAENLKTLVGHRSLADETKDEQVRVAETIELISKLQAQNTQPCRAAIEKLKAGLDSTLERLSVLTDRACKLRQDPNHELTFIQRMFLLFGPEGGYAFVLHALAYVCMLAVPVCILVGGYVVQQQPPEQQEPYEEYSADLVLMACYGALVFRTWALNVRRWSSGYELRPGTFRNILLLRRPVSGWMMTAQVCFWSCLYWLAESLQDFFHDLALALSKGSTLPVAEGLIKFAVPLVTAALCVLWAFAELKHEDTPLSLKTRLMVFRWPKWAALPMLFCLAALTAAVEILLLKPKFLDELPHEISLVLQSLIACIACSQWLSRISQSASVAREKALVQVKSAAA